MHTQSSAELNGSPDVVCFTDEHRAMASRSVLCWLATVDAQGWPSVSPKEVFAVVDHRHMAVANIASPGSSRNLRAQPRVCLSFIDVFLQKGFKVHALAHEVVPSDPAFESWVAPLREMAGDRFPIRSVFVLRVTAIERIVAPSYRLFPAETTEASQIQAALRTYQVNRPEPSPERAHAPGLTDIPAHLQPGTVLRHYKGGLYRVEGACLIEATLEAGILYRPQQGDGMNTLWLRPAHAFDEWVQTESGPVRRFAPVTAP